jgi:hypothetical protein
MFNSHWNRDAVLKCLLMCVILGFELRALCILSRCLLLLLEPCLQPFLLCCFGDKVSLLPRSAWTIALLLYASPHSQDERCVPLHPLDLIGWESLSWPQTWPQTTILLLSASQVARIKDVGYQHLASSKRFCQLGTSSIVVTNKYIILW